MKRVVIESPYSGEVISNVRYAKDCLMDSLNRGEAPIASHLLHTQVLDDSILPERQMGMAAGVAWIPLADILAVYDDRGISRGMAAGIVAAAQANIKIEFRSLKDA